MDTALPDTAKKTAAHTLLAVLSVPGGIKHMVWTYKLVIMGSVQDGCPFSRFFFKIPDTIEDGRGQLIIKIVDMDRIRLEILQDTHQLYPGFPGIYDFKWIQKTPVSGCVEIQTGCILIDAVPKGAAWLIHAEILDLVAFLFQTIANLDDIGF